ncbi:MAG: NAD-dependent epimerase/dehydratase family protein [Flavobacteriales bacterium]|nr:NAD-dependent epimerase/dehydratase family protein [Flavobacteriales bacterium]
MILVTGGTGLLGSHLLLQLLEEGQSVRALYRTEAKRNSVKNIFNYYTDDAQSPWEKIDWVQGDVLDVPSLEDAMQGVTKVYHCAAAVTFLAKERPYMHKVNVEGTANLVNACLESENVRLCHVSSVAAIGRDGSEETIREENEWKDSSHNAAYAISKHHAEMEVWRGVVEGLNAFMVNPSLIIGPGDWNASTGAMFKKAWNGLPFYTRGGNCFVDARDVAQAMIRLMNSDVRDQRFIIGAENRKFKEVFETISAVMEKKPPRFEATPFLTGLTWRAEWLISTLTGKKPFITKEVAHHALQLNRYDNSKLLNELPDFRYRNMDETLEFVSRKFMEDVKATGRI